MLTIANYKIGDKLKVKFRPNMATWDVVIESYEESDPTGKRLNVKGTSELWRSTGIIDNDTQVIENVTDPIDYRQKYYEVVNALKVILSHIKG